MIGPGDLAWIAWAIGEPFSRKLLDCFLSSLGEEPTGEANLGKRK